MSREKEIQQLEDSKITKHHLIGKYQKDLFNVFEPANVTRLRRDTHQALHTLFTDENQEHILEPKLQLKRFLEILKPILANKIYGQLKNITNIDDRKFYKSYLVK